MARLSSRTHTRPCRMLDSLRRIRPMNKNEILIALSESEPTKLGKEEFALQVVAPEGILKRLGGRIRGEQWRILAILSKQ
jgi:hypothetical protein